jgi:hypothetical protein
MCFHGGTSENHGGEIELHQLKICFQLGARCFHSGASQLHKREIRVRELKICFHVGAIKIHEGSVTLLHRVRNGVGVCG